MTGGEVVILGKTGSNFGAGMTGGKAFVYDPEGVFPDHVNPATLHLSRMQPGSWADHLRGLLELHAKETDSAQAKRLLNQWRTEQGHFWFVIPLEVMDKLDPAVDAESVLTASA